MLDIKKYFFDVIHERIGRGANPDGSGVEEGILADVNVSSMPYIFDGFRLPMGNLQMAKLPHGPRVEIPMSSEELEKQIFSQNTI